MDRKEGGGGKREKEGGKDFLLSELPPASPHSLTSAALAAKRQLPLLPGCVLPLAALPLLAHK